MANRISVVIDVAVDRANSALRGLRTSIADADGAFGKFKAGAKSAGDSLKANMVPVAAAAGTAIVAFAAKSVAAASDLEESTNAVNVSFGDAAEGVLKLGDSAAESMGLSKAAFNEAAVGFAAFAQTIAGPGGDAANVIGDLTGRASDFASVMQLDVAEATNVFRSTLSGETEPIKKFGIDMSAAAVEAYALANGLVESKKEMTEAIKVQARYGLLMEKTSKFAGDFANTSDGLANSTRIAQARITDFQAEIGQKLIPTVATAVNAAMDLADAVERLGVKSFDAGERIGDGGLMGAATDAINPLQVLGKLYNSAGDAADYLTGKTEEATEATYDAAEAYIQNQRGLKAYQDQLADDAAAQAYIDNAKGITRELEKQRKAQEEATAATEAATEAMMESRDSSLNYRNQVADTARAVYESSLVQQDATKTDEERAQASRDAEAAVYAQADAAVRLAEDQAEANGETLTADEKTAAYVAELERLTGYLSGPAKAEIEAHIALLKGIPASITTDIGVRRAAGTSRSSSGGGGVGSNIYGATGGIVTRPTLATIGEAGPEAVIPLNSTPGSSPLPSSLSLGGAPTYNFTINGANDPDAIVRAIRQFVRRNGPLQGIT